MTTATAFSHSTVSDYVTLLKPGVMSLVVFTGLAGMVVAPGSLHPLQYILTLLCIAVASGAGAAMNMWYDRDIDAIMQRTSKRPIPMGRVAPDDALAYGLVLSVFSVMIMGLALNWVAGILLAGAIAFYVLIYTMWLKRSTPQNIVIGGAAGAFPPMIGWAAVTGTVSVESLLLFAIIFLWTPPHFWALALYKNADYARANVPMMPVVEGSAHTIKQMVAYTWLLVACSLFPYFLDMAGVVYTAIAAVLGGQFLLLVHRLHRGENESLARKTFGFSILYLFLLFTAMMADHWVTLYLI